jgi:hypothetical protein
MKLYNTPQEHYFRLHHVRPRFKGDIESVLLFMATEISRLSGTLKEEFNKKLNDAIKMYPGNEIKNDKTIDNWRTEIAALFSFYFEYSDDTIFAGTRAKELAEKQDLVEMFKIFLFLFQYPGGHIKAEKILEMIESGIHFKPAQYILKVLQAGETDTGNRTFLLREEVCHCIFNDLRCTRDNEEPLIVWKRIKTNRYNEYNYDKTGDVVRYAGDILDYMEIANLLNCYDNNKYYINKFETEAVMKFINSNQWFFGYDSMIKHKKGSLDAINNENENWFNYANKKINETNLQTNILTLISTGAEEENEIKEENLESFKKSIENNDNSIDSKTIGDMGESLVHSHECQRIKLGGREDLIHLIKRIPTQLAIGYDIQSLELDEQKRYIEVKTTISSKPIQFNKFHMTTNEWVVAESNHDRYFIYRLLLSKHTIRLYIIQDPVGLYKKDIIRMIPRDGADIIFNDNAGTEEELLIWKK